MVASRPAVQKQKLKTRARMIAKALAREYPEALCALKHEGPFQLLAATILSAQCTDERVNQVTPGLFSKFPTPHAMAQATSHEIESLIRSTGFFRAKAKNLLGMAQMIVDEFGGEIPRTIDQLVRLPGVGRKTANVVLGTAFGLPMGVVVDTHVKRLTSLMGLTRHKIPEKIEQDLMELLPSTDWIDFSHRLIHHGRRICIARRPRCRECPLLSLCSRAGLPKLAEERAEKSQTAHPSSRKQARPRSKTGRT